jgi:hypothetical protein
MSNVLDYWSNWLNPAGRSTVAKLVVRVGVRRVDDIRREVGTNRGRLQVIVQPPP